MNLRLLPVLTALAITLPGQNRDPDVDVTGEDKRAAVKPVDPDDGSLKEAGEVKEVKLSPEEIANIGVRRGAGSLCKLYLHTKPARLMPGQSGKIIITAALGGQAVLPSPAPIEITSPLQQGLVTLGNFEVQPAKIGQGTAAAYLGRPVYDNTARIEMPITLGSAAVVGMNMTVAVEMRFELYDGKTGQSLGKFLDRAMGQVEVGPSHDPAVQGGYAPPTIDHGSGAAAAGGTDTAAASASTVRPRDAIGAAEPMQVAAPRVEPKPEPAAHAGPVELPDEDGMPMMLLVGGGALVAAVVLLLVAKKK